MTEDHSADASNPVRDVTENGVSNNNSRQQSLTIRPTFRPGRPGEGRDTGKLILRSGRQLDLVRVLAEDAEKVGGFLRRLPKADRLDMERSLQLDRKRLQAYFEKQLEEESGYSFLVENETGEEAIAFVSYQLMPGLKDTAWMGLAVDRKWRREGIGLLLLERISVIAARSGVLRLIGFSDAENHPLLALLRSTGFEADVREDSGRARFLISTRAVLDTTSRTEAIAARSFVTASLLPLFRPSSVAVIGASRNPSSLGNRIVAAIVNGGFRGPVFPVNPRAEHIRSIRAYPSLEAIGRQIDLAVIVVPAEEIPAVVDHCAGAGVKALIIISAYYSEVGHQGRVREKRLSEQVRRHKMRMLGPNCMGLIQTDPEIRLNASFAPQMPTSGCAALCSQSGALGVAITALAQRLGLGLSSLVNVGNRADITVNDLLEYWEEDDTTRVVLFYLESFGDPRRFARVARRIGRRKPIVVVRGGRSRAGRRAEAEPEDSFEATNIAVEALFSQTGIIRAENLEEMFDIARALTTQPLPRGPRVAVITNAGGAGILAADALANAGLEVFPLSQQTRAALKRILPGEALTRNPVDMLAASDAAAYQKTVALLLEAEETDALVVIYTPLGMADDEEVTRAVARGVRSVHERGSGRNKPVLISIVGDGEDRTVTDELGEEELPVYSFPGVAGRVLGKILGYSQWRSRETGVFPEFRDQKIPALRKLCREILARMNTAQPRISDVQRFLDLGGLKGIEGRRVSSAEEAAAAARETGFPVLLRVLGPDEAENSGTKIEITSTDELDEVFSDLGKQVAVRNDGSGIFVQRVYPNHIEVSIRVLDDPRFGPLIGLRLGGGLLEAVNDEVFRISPLTDLDAVSMVRELRGARVFDGWKGLPPGDIRALEEMLLRTSRLVESLVEVRRLILDPVLVLPPGRGCRIGAARVLLHQIRIQ